MLISLQFSPFITSVRLVLYDAGGDFERDFDWWDYHGVVESELLFSNDRTDILIGCGSRLDIENVNLLATLLLHTEADIGIVWGSSSGTKWKLS
jgi:hypothetical protein